MAGSVAVSERLEQLSAKYSKLPSEAILKEDVLTLGVSPEAGLSLPDVARLVGGPLGLRPTIVRLRVSPESCYQARQSGNGFVVLDTTTAREIAVGCRFPQRPAFETKQFADGTLMSSVMDGRGVVHLPL